jgi:hypothetical protein
LRDLKGLSSEQRFHGLLGLGFKLLSIRFVAGPAGPEMECGRRLMMSLPVIGSVWILIGLLESPVARSIHIGKTCSRDRFAFPTGSAQNTQLDQPGSSSAFGNPGTHLLNKGRAERP